MNNSQENTNEQVKISSRLIKNKRIINQDVLSQKYQYNMVGSNGFLEIEPKEVKFCGFESNKINVQKVKIINTSPYSQRMHIIGPKGADKNFEIKYESRGQLAPGMSEDIIVLFKASKKEYYFDQILIHCENEKLQIPIHAYPAMTSSSLQHSIFPKLIDFGNVKVNESSTLYFPIANKTTYAFEFEFRLVPNKSQLSDQILIHPMSGIVPVKDQVEISITFSPKTNSTVVYEFQLDLSQFEFQLQTIKIYGTGKNINDHSFKKTHPIKLKSINFNKSVEVIQENDEESQTDPINNSLLTKNNKSQQGQGHSKKLFSQQQTQNQEQTKNYKTLLNPESKNKSQSNKNDTKQREQKQEKDEEKRLQQEKQFLEKFNKVQHLDKEKEIKFFKCIGDYKITESEVETILEERRSVERKQNQEIEKKGVHRYQIEIGTDFPKIEQKMPDQECKWDVIKNDKMKKRELLGEIFRRNVTKVIISKLMESRLNAIKKLLGVKQLSDFKLITKQEVRKLVLEDWLNAEREGTSQEDKTKYEFIFEESSIKQLLFPIQYDQTNQFSNHKFEIDARNGFDDMTQLENLKYSDAEAMDYQLMETPAVMIHNSIESNRKMRTGAEEEYYLMGETGYLDKLKQDDLLFEKLGETFNQAFYTVPHKLLVPDPFLREHETYESITEISPEYNLQKQHIFQSDTDFLEIVSNNPKSKQNFLISCPGLSSNKPLQKMKIEQSYYYQKREVLPYEQGFINDIAEYCPQLLDGCQEDDKYSEGDSDNEENLEITYENHLEFLKKIQNNPNDPNNNQQDQEIQYFNKSKHIDSIISQNIAIDKKERISLMPSKTYDFNKFIINPENRIFIL